MCLAVAESYALQHKRVLVLLTDIDELRGRHEGNRDHDGTDTVEPRLIRRPLQSAGGSLRKGRRLRRSRFEHYPHRHDDAGRRRDSPDTGNTGYITEGQFYLRHGRIEPFGSLSRLKQQVNDKTRGDHRAIMDT
jgi:V/A-type H+-transporting ATPase subunit B